MLPIRTVCACAIDFDYILRQVFVTTSSDTFEYNVFQCCAVVHCSCIFGKCPGEGPSDTLE